MSATESVSRTILLPLQLSCHIVLKRSKMREMVSIKLFSLSLKDDILQKKIPFSKNLENKQIS